MPADKSGKAASQAVFVRAHNAIDTKSSAPQITAHRAISGRMPGLQEILLAVEEVQSCLPTVIREPLKFAVADDTPLAEVVDLTPNFLLPGAAICRPRVGTIRLA
jgi:hypothetical protein